MEAETTAEEDETIEASDPDVDDDDDDDEPREEVGKERNFVRKRIDDIFRK